MLNRQLVWPFLPSYSQLQSILSKEARRYSALLLEKTIGGENLSTLSWTPFTVQITWNSSFILHIACMCVAGCDINKY